MKDDKKIDYPNYSYPRYDRDRPPEPSCFSEYQEKQISEKLEEIKTGESDSRLASAYEQGFKDGIEFTKSVLEN